MGEKMKVLITENTIVNVGDDRGGVHAGAGSLPDVPADVARRLVLASRALYTNRKDDPDKAGSNTAPDEVVKAAEAVVKELAAAAKAQKAE
jgi:hypothetical protein